MVFSDITRNLARPKVISNTWSKSISHANYKLKLTKSTKTLTGGFNVYVLFKVCPDLQFKYIRRRCRCLRHKLTLNDFAYLLKTFLSNGFGIQFDGLLGAVRQVHNAPHGICIYCVYRRLNWDDFRTSKSYSCCCCCFSCLRCCRFKAIAFVSFVFKLPRCFRNRN